eukprot:g2538.t1
MGNVQCGFCSKPTKAGQVRECPVCAKRACRECKKIHMKKMGHKFWVCSNKCLHSFVSRRRDLASTAMTCFNWVSENHIISVSKIQHAFGNDSPKIQFQSSVYGNVQNFRISRAKWTEENKCAVLTFRAHYPSKGVLAYMRRISAEPSPLSRKILTVSRRHGFLVEDWKLYPTFEHPLALKHELRGRTLRSWNFTALTAQDAMRNGDLLHNVRTRATSESTNIMVDGKHATNVCFVQIDRNDRLADYRRCFDAKIRRSVRIKRLRGLLWRQFSKRNPSSSIVINKHHDKKRSSADTDVAVSSSSKEPDHETPNDVDDSAICGIYCDANWLIEIEHRDAAKRGADNAHAFDVRVVSTSLARDSDAPDAPVVVVEKLHIARSSTLAPTFGGPSYDLQFTVRITTKKSGERRGSVAMFSLHFSFAHALDICPQWRGQVVRRVKGAVDGSKQNIESVKFIKIDADSVDAYKEAIHLHSRRRSLTVAIRDALDPGVEGGRDILPVTMHSNDSGSIAGASERLVRRPSPSRQLAKVTHFTPSEVQALRLHFVQIVGSADSFLEFESFRCLLGIIGMSTDSLLVRRLFSVLDLERCGRIFFDDYCKGLSVLLKGTVDERLNFSFDMVDQDADGFVTFEEFSTILESTVKVFEAIMGVESDTGVESFSILSARLRDTKSLFNRFDRDREDRISRKNYVIGLQRNAYRFAHFLTRSSFVDEMTKRRNSFVVPSHSETATKTSPRRLFAHPDDDRLQRTLERARKIADKMDAKITILEASEKQRQLKRLDDEGSDAASKQQHTAVSGSVLSTAERTVAIKELARQCRALKRCLYEKRGAFVPSKVERRRSTDPLKHSHSLGDVIVKSSSNFLSSVIPVLKRENRTPGSGERRRNQSVLMRNTKGDVVFFGHKDWELVMKIMQGIQLAVNRAAISAVRVLTTHDYEVKEKYTLRRRMKEHAREEDYERSILNVDTLYEGHCRFVDYAPSVFLKLRKLFGISDAEYVNSIGPAHLLANLLLGSLSSLSQLGSEGKSGSFFYFTSDLKYMVKTISKEEHSLFRVMLESYYHFLWNHPDSLLCRIVGCHQIRFGKHSRFGSEKMYFIVMLNCFPTDVEMDVRYDLKGSWVGRSAGKDKWNKKGACLKDQDLRRMGTNFRLSAARRKRLLSALEDDSFFLKSHGIIDYSLLLGVVHKSNKNSPIATFASAGNGAIKRRSSMSDATPKVHRLMVRHGSSSNSTGVGGDYTLQNPFYQADNGGLTGAIGSEDEGKMFYMGVIDILTLFTAKKRWELFGKRIAIDWSGQGVSVQPPGAYQKRFMAFMRSIFLPE